MSENKYAVIGSVTFLIAAIVGSLFIWKHTNAPITHQQTSNNSSVSSGPNSIPLSQRRPAETNTESSDVKPTNKTNTPPPKGQTMGAANQGQTMNLNNNSQTKSPFDPSTFGEYEKYKNENGARFADIQKGSGDELTKGKTAQVVYKGWLTNGQLFDQSRTNSEGKIETFSFELGAHQVITGWEQGMEGMQVGGVRLLIIPPSVGYGAQGQGSIPPNAVLIFQVQLVAVN